MKYIFKIILVLVLSGCNQINNKNSGKSEIDTLKTDKSNIDINDNRNTCKLSEKFHHFREILESDNIDNAKKFIDFPFTNRSIWHLIFMDSEQEDFDTSRNLNEDDFKKYYKQIFPSELIESLKNVNINDLFNKGSHETLMKDKFNKEGEIETKYKLNTNFDDLNKELTLSMYYEFYEDGEVYETSVIYNLIMENCKLKLSNVILAN